MKTKRILTAICVMCAAGTMAPRILHAASPMLPNDYDQLNRKSIFSRNRQTVSPFGGGDRRPVRPVRPIRNYTPVFIGALAEDAGYFVAFIENPSSGQMMTFIEGDALPDNAGTIKDIALDYIETASATPGGPNKKIMIGQTILGGAAEYPNGDNQSAGSGSMQNGPGGGRQFGNNGPGGPPNDNGGGPDDGSDAGPGGPPPTGTAAPAAPAPDNGSDDLITRLRKRRQAQLGG